MIRYLSVVVIVLLTFPFLTDAQENLRDARNFYGISWRGTAKENLTYAKHMGFDYVFYQRGMERESTAVNMRFYMETPEYYVYNRRIDLKKKYTEAEIEFYEKYCAIGDSKKAFPHNLATGWFFDDHTFSAQLDFSRDEVIEWAIESILTKIDRIQKINPQFKFGGFAWDVPQLSGDFWSAQQKSGGRQVEYVHFSKSSGQSYEDGVARYYIKLFKVIRDRYPEAKFIMEPYNIYDGWLKNVEGRPDKFELMPDILAQERTGSDFINDVRIFQTGLIDRKKVMCTAPSIYSEIENRRTAGMASVSGQIFSWFGRFGGTGEMPNYKSIREVPDRLKLIRQLTIWEELNGTSLSERFWDGEVYQSVTAFVSDAVIAIKHPKEDALYIVILKESANISLHDKFRISKVYDVDDLFMRTNLSKSVSVKNGRLVVSSSALNKGFICNLSDQK